MEIVFVIQSIYLFLFLLALILALNKKLQYSMKLLIVKLEY